MDDFLFSFFFFYGFAISMAKVVYLKVVVGTSSEKHYTNRMMLILRGDLGWKYFVNIKQE